MIDEAITVICALLGIIGLLLLMYYGGRWLNKHYRQGSFGTAQRSVKINECVSIAPDKQLMIVTVGSRIMLLGVTPNAVNKICDLDESDLTLPESTAEGESSFMQNLKKAFAERSKGTDSGADTKYKEDGRNEKDDF